MKTFFLLAVLLAFLSAACQRGISLDDPDLQCDPNYRVCFTPSAQIDKSFPQPFHLTDLTATTRQNPPNPGTIPGRYVNMLHYPGSLYRIEDRTNYAPGGGYVNNILFKAINASQAKSDSFFSLSGCTNQAWSRSEWRPDRISITCTTGMQFSLMGVSKDIYLGKLSFRGTSTTATGPSRLTWQEAGQWKASVNEWGTWNGYQGWKRTTVTDTIYVLFSNPPGIIGTPPAVTGVTFTTSYDGYVAYLMNTSLSQVPDLFTNPETWRTNAVAFYQDWYRQHAAPTETTNWGKERYYRSLNTHLFLQYDTYNGSNTHLWNQYRAISPGGHYHGVWIWDSFFQAWAAIQTCLSADCVEDYFDALRILRLHQMSDGQYPRQVEHYTKSGTGTWQAPGGWSFAADQADRKFGTNYGAEFYVSLARFHNYTRTKDSDGDGVYEWGGTNSGMDSSPRWYVGNPLNAVDLQAWMIIDAESLRNIAGRNGNTADETMWESRRQAYISAIQPYCSPGPYCFDKTRGRTVTSTKLTPATYFLLFAGALSQSQAQAMLPGLHDTALLGPGTGDIGILPSLSRSDPDYSPDAVTSTWGGPYWTNLAFITYYGLLRYGLNTEAEYVRTRMQNLLQQGGVDMESYTSAGNVGATPMQVGFANPYYGWTASAVMLFSTPNTFVFGLLGPACSAGQTEGCQIGSDIGTRLCEANNQWGPCIVCTAGNTRSCPTGTQTCVLPGQWAPCTGACVDADSDGYSPGTQTGCTNGDCNDNAASIHPGATESCTNSVDDDCDGQINEGCTCSPTWVCGDWTACVNGWQTQTCTNCGSGSTSTNGRTCTVTCDPLLIEACNGLDDNCNGQTDEGCVVCTPTTEICDGQDNDCDQQIDEGCTCTDRETQPCGISTGECSQGTQTCTAGNWGTCSGNTGPVPETCNTYDDNCNGQTDEAITNNTGCPQNGPCIGAARTCVGGTWTECSPPARPETCDNQDEDCDAQIDNGLVRACINNTNPGTQVCNAGAWRTCTATSIVTASAVNNTCIGDPQGTYLNMAECQASLSGGNPPPPPNLTYYRCLDYACVEDPNGIYVTESCGAGCGTPPPSPPEPKPYIFPMAIILGLVTAIITISLIDKAKNKR